MPLDRAALIGCGVTTGVGAVFNTAKVEPGSTVAVIGAGRHRAQTASRPPAISAPRVSSPSTASRKAQLAKRFGATDLVDASDGEAVAPYRSSPGWRAVRVRSDRPEGHRRGASDAAPGAPRRSSEMNPDRSEGRDPGYELSREEAPGVEHGLEPLPRRHARYIDLYMDGRLKLDELVSQRIALPRDQRWLSKR